MKKKRKKKGREAGEN